MACIFIMSTNLFFFTFTKAEHFLYGARLTHLSTLSHFDHDKFIIFKFKFPISLILEINWIRKAYLIILHMTEKDVSIK